MIRALALGLLGAVGFVSIAAAQGAEEPAGPTFPGPQLRRLPPVAGAPVPPEQLPAPPAEDLPDDFSADSWTDPSANSSPEAELPPDSEPAVPAKLWAGSVELGLDGTEGNSETFNLRFGADAKRKRPGQVLSLDLDYHRGTIDSVASAHRMFFEWRQQWLHEELPWTYFIHGTVEYDEFRAFDVRVALDSGVGYRFVQTDDTELLGRIGGGVSHEVGVPDEVYVPELVFGLDLEHDFSERQKVTASADYMPDVTDFGDFRLNTKAAWEALIDQQMNLSLKVQVRNQYDSTPNGAEPNDLDYSVVLLWKF